MTHKNVCYHNNCIVLYATISVSNFSKFSEKICSISTFVLIKNTSFSRNRMCRVGLKCILFVQIKKLLSFYRYGVDWESSAKGSEYYIVTGAKHYALRTCI